MTRIRTMIQKLLHLDENDNEVARIKKQGAMKAREVMTSTAQVQSQLKIIKSQTYYFGKALGVIVPRK